MFSSLKKKEDFKKVYDGKRFFSTKNLVMYVIKKETLEKEFLIDDDSNNNESGKKVKKETISKNCDMERNRLGISVSRKVGNSVVRHTLVRRLREIFRKCENDLKNFYDIVVVLRVGADKKEFFCLYEDFVYLCKKHGIMKKVED